VSLRIAKAEAERRFFSAEAREPVPPLIPLPAVKCVSYETIRAGYFAVPALARGFLVVDFARFCRALPNRFALSG
jgi:hypothetical protein